MAEKSFHKGWLYERDGVKFAPYTLKESIIDRAGEPWANDVDNKIEEIENAITDITGSTVVELQGQISDVSDRTTALEVRTQYLDATESDVFYITDADGNIALKVDGTGATSFNFITPLADLNDLSSRTTELEDAVGSLYGESLITLQNQIIALQERTQYMDASEESDTFYITDANGNIAAKINGEGITSFNFISQGVTDLNSLYEELQNQGIEIQELASVVASILNEKIPAIYSDIGALQTRTKYMDASDENDTFYVTDGSGNIAAQINKDGVTSFNFISQGVGDLNSLYDDVEAIDIRVQDLEVAVPEIKEETDLAIANVADRVTVVESRTKYMNASNDTNTFYITDGDGNIAMKVDEEGVTSFEFIVDGVKLKQAIDELSDKDNELSNAITTLDNTLNGKIDNTKTELSETINGVKTELSTAIDTNRQEIDETIAAVKAELDEVDNELNNAVSDLTDRTVTLETRTKYMDASDENDTFYITDGEGNIAMQVDESGITSFDFTIPDLISLSEVHSNLNKEIKDREAADKVLADKDNELGNAITALETNLTTQISEAKTELNTKIDNTKTELSENIISVQTNLNKKIDEIKDELDDKDTELGNAIGTLETNLTTKITETKTELTNTINSVKSDLSTAIDTNRQEIDETITTMKSELDSTDTELGNAIAELADRAVVLETRTKYMDASDETDTFYITDDEGNIGMQVDINGITSFDFIIPDLISLSEVNTNLNKEIKDREAADKTINENLAALEEHVTTQDDALDGKIDSTKKELTELVEATQKTLEKDIDDTAAAINKTITDLATELKEKDNTLSDGIADNTAEIGKLQTRMGTAETDIDNLQTNSATKTELENNVKALAADIQTNADAIAAIEALDVEQNDTLADLSGRTYTLETRTQYIDGTASDTFDIVDEAGNVGMRVSNDGVIAHHIYLKTTQNNDLPVIGYQKVTTISI